MFLSNFCIQKPVFRFDQQFGLNWLAAAHVKAEKKRNVALNEHLFHEKIKKEIERVCCKAPHVAHRSAAFPSDHPLVSGDFGDRGRFFSQYIEGVFEEFYPPSSSPPDDLIHVTCTGYQSPSGAQKIVNRRKWLKETTVTHAYHMGCLGSLPAIRMGMGFAAMGKKQIDIVHTELCSVHFNPGLHEPDQLVIQSLFGDGLIKYTLSQKQSGPAFVIKALHEEVIENSEEEMKWGCESWGLKMTLTKKVPALLSRYILPFIERFEKKVGHPLKSESMFAIHPGGPKILEMITEKLELTERQMAPTRTIFSGHGNMSSATLPHIWEEILKNENYPSGTQVVGLAFGPGITMSGILLEKVE